MDDDKEMQELEALFRDEAHDHLNTINRLMLQLETDDTITPDNHREIVREMFRAAHSIKGAARTVNYPNIQKISHAIENVFEALRQEQITLSPDVADVVYDGLDVIERLLAKNAEGLDIEAVVQALNALPGDKSAVQSKLSPPVQPPVNSAPSSSPVQEVEPEPDESPVEADTDRRLMTRPQSDPAPLSSDPDETIRVALSRLDTVMTETGNLMVSRLNINQNVQNVKKVRTLHHHWQKQWRSIHNDYIRLLRTTTDQPDQMEEWQPVLNFLQETRHYMKQIAGQLQTLEHDMNDNAMMLSLATDNLQSGVRDMRLLPFETIVGGLQRMVRDVARELQKDVVLQPVGVHIELDRHVLENIKDPLNHMLRNAIDHGIESPQERAAAGKPQRGMVLLVLSRRGNAVSIMVSDDGYGIDTERVRQKAVDSGLINETEVEKLEEQEIYTLLMHPGMSTARQINDISGRGVGLDIVRENIETLQGQIIIDSEPGQGTTFEIILPVSLSTLHCLLVRSGEETYAIPGAAVQRVVFYRETDTFTVKGQQMLVVDDQPVSVSRLSEVLERPVTADSAKPLALVLSGVDRSHAFIVDDIIAEQEVVVRSLNTEMARVRNVSGATLLGDGRVVLILNVADLLKSARGQRVYRRQVAVTPEKIERPPCILVVDDSITTRTLQRNILEASGYRVIIATQGKEALEKLTAQGDDIDLMISDVEMPLMNGFELTGRVRQHPRFSTLPIILVTSLDSQENKERGFKAGADAYIVKGGFDQNELLATIQNLL